MSTSTNEASDFAYNLFRTGGQFYKALISRPTEKVKRYTIAAEGTVKVMNKGNPHTVRIRNVGLVDVRFAHDEDGAESSTEYLALQVGEQKYFEYHISGFEWLEHKGKFYQRAIFHCEWSDDMYVYNPDATNAATVEVLIIG